MNKITPLLDVVNMGRKRKEGITTNIRYKMKAYSVGLGIASGNEKLAMEYAEALTIARASGIGPYKMAYAEIKPVLMKNEVPSALFGLYKAFINEIIAKAQVRKIASTDEVIDKWTTLGLDAGVLGECVEAVGEVIVTAAPTPAPKIT